MREILVNNRPYLDLVALDQIITQLMENNNTGRPVPATDEIVEKLPREVLDIGCKL